MIGGWEIHVLMYLCSERLSYKTTFIQSFKEGNIAKTQHAYNTMHIMQHITCNAYNTMHVKQ